MKHHAKAASVDSISATGSSRGLFGRSFATRGASGDAVGSGAPFPAERRSFCSRFSRRSPASPSPPLPPSLLRPRLLQSYPTSPTPPPMSPAKSTPRAVVSPPTLFRCRPTEPTGRATPGVLLPIGNGERRTHWNGRWNPVLRPNRRQQRILLAGSAGNDFRRAPPLLHDLDRQLADDTRDGFRTDAVFSTSATGTGEVIRPVDSDDANCRFEYVTDAQFTATGFADATARDCSQNPIGQADAGTNKAVTAALGCTARLPKRGAASARTRPTTCGWLPKPPAAP